MTSWAEFAQQAPELAAFGKSVSRSSARSEIEIAVFIAGVNVIALIKLKGRGIGFV